MIQSKMKPITEKLVKDHYKSPIKLAQEFSEMKRKEKHDMLKTIEQMRRSLSYQLPAATKHKIDALAFKKMHQDQQAAREAEDPELTLRPDLTKTLKYKKTKVYYHNGKYEKHMAEEKECWSCCMNAEKESEGCVAVIKDKSKWILSGH